MHPVPTYVALLRGVNVGGHNTVPMATLRQALETSGLEQVRTYIQSGNVVLDARMDDAAAVAAQVREVIATSFGLDIATIAVASSALAAVVAANPYPDETDHRRLHAIFLPSPLDDASREQVRALQDAATQKGTRDTCTVDGTVMYLHTPEGFGTSELAKALSTKGRGIHRSGTARNWATVTALLALCES